MAMTVAVAPRPAQACGGTFCDGGPNPMPVEQTGETILFVVEDGHVEAHIQIEYDPDTEAEQFAWVVPVTAVPELSVGSQQLFANVMAATVPSYGLGNWVEPCGDEPVGDPDMCNAEGGDVDGDGLALDAGGGSGPDDGPNVVSHEAVGAFEVFVLDGGTADGVMQWLGDNGFTQDEAARPILQEYLAEGHLFVAFRLLAYAGASEIHPIVLRYEGQEPCIPIRLTRIAAQDDLEIRAVMLAEGRFASSNYRDVTLNPLKIDWMNSGMNYRDVVSRAIDEPGAGGHAFVTEYAGPADVVSRIGLPGLEWDAEVFRNAASPGEAVEALFDQQLVGYGDDGICGGLHPLVEGLITRHLPTPPDNPIETMCDDPAAFASAVPPDAWTGERFAMDFEVRIVEPALHAQELLDTWPYLTRMVTMLSPHEMTLDPMFHATPDLPMVTGLTRVGTRNRFCSGETSFSLPSGDLVALRSGGWPDIRPDQMPWAETIAYLPPSGAPVIEVDNRPLIGELLDAWNEEFGPPRSPTSLASLDPCGDPGQWPPQPGSGAVDDGRGCGCSNTGPGAGWAWILALGVGGLLTLRRRDEPEVLDSVHDR